MATRTRAASTACALMVGVLALAGCASLRPNIPKEESSKPAIVPMPDQASIQQVIDPAKEFVVLNQLQDVTGSFGWVACGGQNEALYYGEVRLFFLLPKDIDEKQYIRQMAKMMVSHGWMDGPAQGDRSFGTLLHTNEVRAAITGGDAVDRETGKIRLSGECRNTTDHREHSTAVDITARLLQR
jgi:hypothetical protein